MSDRSDLLAALRPGDRNILFARLSEVHLATGTILYDPGQSVDYCYFPCGGAIASFFVLLENGIIVETLMGAKGRWEGSSAMARAPPMPGRA